MNKAPGLAGYIRYAAKLSPAPVPPPPPVVAPAQPGRVQLGCPYVQAGFPGNQSSPVPTPLPIVVPAQPGRMQPGCPYVQPGFPGNESTPIPSPLPFVEWSDFLQAILGHLSQAGIFNPFSTFWSIRPDSEINWPAAPYPIAYLVPHGFPPAMNDGLGRFGKIYETPMTLNIIVENILDESYYDSTSVNSDDPSNGAYRIAGDAIDAMEQAYIVTPLGNYATIELPEATRIGKPHRFGEANNFILLTVDFRMSVVQQLS